MITSSDPKTLNPPRDALVARDVRPSSDERVAAPIFTRGEIVIREVRVYSSGEWGFVRSGMSWMMGPCNLLRGLLKPGPGK
jgi:hypothetical protein